MLKKYFLLILVFIAYNNYAQCAMCRATLESEGNQDMAMGVNRGIQYLMIFPYLILIFLGYFVYRLVKKSNEATEE
jgi:hypothetical protein